eukprot:764822-Hanusia_phi.AAC.1
MWGRREQERVNQEGEAGRMREREEVEGGRRRGEDKRGKRSEEEEEEEEEEDLLVYSQSLSMLKGASGMRQMSTSLEASAAYMATNLKRKG